MKAISLITAVMWPALCADAAYSAFCVDPAFEAKLKTNQVGYEYVEPTNAAHRPIYDALKERRVLESLSQFLRPFRFPRTLTLTVQGCDGHVNSYYWRDKVTVCYEYLDSLLKAAPVKAMSYRQARRVSSIRLTPLARGRRRALPTSRHPTG